MSDLYYRSPIDDLLTSPLIKSREEILSDNFLKNTNTISVSPSNDKNDFQATLKEVEKQKNKGCNNLIPIDCGAPSESLDKANQNIQKQIENSLENIVNASQIAYRKKLPYMGLNNQPLFDDTPGALQKTNWQFDLGITGMGQGFKLSNGEYTRDGRFKFNIEGRPVSLNNEIPLEVCYEESAPMDWSLKKLRIDFEGSVFDKLNGKKLGKIQVDMEPRSKIMQSYLERSNINLPLEFMGLQQQLRLIDLNNNVMTTGAKLDSEAVQNLTRLTS